MSRLKQAAIGEAQAAAASDAPRPQKTRRGAQASAGLSEGTAADSAEAVAGPSSSKGGAGATRAKPQGRGKAAQGKGKSPIDPEEVAADVKGWGGRSSNKGRVFPSLRPSPLPGTTTEPDSLVFPPFPCGRSGPPRDPSREAADELLAAQLQADWEEEDKKLGLAGASGFSPCGKHRCAGGPPISAEKPERAG